MQKISIFIFITLLSTSCSLVDPIIYRIPIQQGNILDKEQVDKVKIGMTKDQVEFVLGTPLVTDAFDNDYWEYLYVMTASNGDAASKTLVVLFKDGKLTAIEGDFNDEKDAEKQEDN